MNASSLTEKVKSYLPSMGGGRQDPESTDLEELIQTKESLEEELGEQNEQVQRLQRLIDEELDDRAKRAAETAERMRELEHEKKEQKQSMEELRDRLNSVQQEQEAGSVQVAAPDSEFLKEKPVFSAMGKEFFGMFDEWITSQGKVGIKCVDPHGEQPPQKVGWADSIRDLVVDANNLTHHKAVIVKLDGNQERMERMVSPQRHQEELQKRERAEDRAQRLSSENDQLIQQKKELKDQRDKALIALNRMRMKMADRDSPARDVTTGLMSEEIDILHEHIDNQSEILKHRNDETKRVIDNRERERAQELDALTDDELDRAFDIVGKATGRTMDNWEQIKDHLSETQQRKVLEKVRENGDDAEEGMEFSMEGEE